MAGEQKDKSIVQLDIQPTGVVASGNDPEREDDDDEEDSSTEGQPAQEDVPRVNVRQREGFGERLDLDLSTLDKGYNYRWINKSPRQVSRKRSLGYVVVQPSQESKIKNFAGERLEPHADGTYTEGDLILMKCPKRIHRVRRAAVEHQAQTRLGVEKKKLRKGFLRKARDAGVEVITTREPGKE